MPVPILAGLVGGKAVDWLIKLWPLWVGIALFCAGVIALNVHDARVRREAIAEKEAELKVCGETVRKAAMALQESREAINKLQAAYADQTAAIDELEQREAAAKSRGDKVLADFHAKERRLRVEIQKLRAEVEKPAPTPEISCEQADAILHDLAVRQKAEMP